MIAVGGWNLGSEPFCTIVHDPRNRNVFIDDCVTFLRTHEFDGLDVDWEYPGENEKDLYVIFCQVR